MERPRGLRRSNADKRRHEDSTRDDAANTANTGNTGNAAAAEGADESRPAKVRKTDETDTAAASVDADDTDDASADPAELIAMYSEALEVMAGGDRALGIQLLEGAVNGFEELLHGDSAGEGAGVKGDDSASTRVEVAQQAEKTGGVEGTGRVVLLRYAAKCWCDIGMAHATDIPALCAEYLEMAADRLAEAVRTDPTNGDALFEAAVATIRRHTFLREAAAGHDESDSSDAEDDDAADTAETERSPGEFAAVDTATANAETCLAAALSGRATSPALTVHLVDDAPSFLASHLLDYALTLGGDRFVAYATRARKHFEDAVAGARAAGVASSGGKGSSADVANALIALAVCLSDVGGALENTDADAAHAWLEQALERAGEALTLCGGEPSLEARCHKVIGEAHINIGNGTADSNAARECYRKAAQSLRAANNADDGCVPTDAIDDVLQLAEGDTSDDHE